MNDERIEEAVNGTGEREYPCEADALAAVAKVQADTTPDATAALPTDARARLEYPLCTGLLLYFPRACAAVARHSKESNDQHNPGEPMHWAVGKSIGTGDQIARHLVDALAEYADAGPTDSVERHLSALAWRGMELLERYKRGMPPFDWCATSALGVAANARLDRQEEAYE